MAIPATLCTAAKRCVFLTAERSPIEIIRCSTDLLADIRRQEDGKADCDGSDRAELRRRAAVALGRCFGASLCLLRQHGVNADVAWAARAQIEIRHGAKEAGAKVFRDLLEYDSDDDGIIGKVMRGSVLAAKFGDGKLVDGCTAAKAEECLPRIVERIERALRGGDLGGTVSVTASLLTCSALAAHMRGIGPAALWSGASGRRPMKE